MAKKKDIIGLDLGHSVVKLVEYSSKKKQVTTIAKLFLESTEWDNEISLSSKLQAWMEEKKQAAAPEVVSSISARHAIIKPVFVARDEKNISDAIRFEMEHYLSSPLEDFAFSWQTLADSKTQNQKILVAAYRKSEINRYKALIHNRNLPLTVLDIDVFAAFNAFITNYPEYANGLQYIIKADLDLISGIYCQDGQFHDTHNIPLPDSFITAEDKERGHIISETCQQIKTLYENGLKSFEDSPANQKFIICGDLATDEEFAQALDAVMPLEMEKLNAFKEVEFPHDPEYADKVLETAPQCATALGLALRYKGDG
ncbi:MAG: pilus assembly protein PilM [Fibrobacteria bacterium]|nr:pilus assembly protein PilM [Fibrobacteria bacterium]